MSQIKLVALRRHPFGVGQREKGEEYVANPDEAKILTALGWAREAGNAPPAAVKPALAATPAAKKQTYRTRDMKAKD